MPLSISPKSNLAYAQRQHSQRAWRGGKVDLSGSVTTLGTDSDFLLNLRSQGTFQARSVDLLPIIRVICLRTLRFNHLAPRSADQTHLASSGGRAERFLGQGTTQADGGCSWSWPPRIA